MEKGKKMLKINHLTKQYPGSSKGVSDLVLHVLPGDLYAFIGHNGAGKTTTLKAVCGIHSFESGEIFVDGIDVKKDALSAQKLMAYIPDNPDLFEYLTGIQYLNFVGDVFALPADIRKERIRNYADAFALTSSLGDLISTYSHGMKQKLAIISAMIHTPKLLVLDEPFVGLDPKAALVLKDFMRELCKNGGAVFFSTHVLEVAEKLCNKVAIIKDGKLVVSGDMSDIVRENGSLESIFMEVAVNV